MRSILQYYYTTCGDVYDIATTHVALLTYKNCLLAIYQKMQIFPNNFR